MALYEFNALDETEQHEQLWEYGVHIGEREADEYKIVLYQIHSFYVELFYYMEHNVLKKLKSFSDTELLDVYLINSTQIFSTPILIKKIK